MSADSDDVFSLARETAKEYSQQLGENENIDVIQFSGPIGFQAIVGEGTPLGRQVQLATLLAINEQLQRELFAEDVESTVEAEEQIDSALSRIGVELWNAEAIAADARKKLEDWQDYHEDDAEEVSG